MKETKADTATKHLRATSDGAAHGPDHRRGHRERATRTEEDAAAVRRFEENVAKLEAKKELRNKMLKAEREAFRRQQSEMGEAIYRSEVGSAVITDTQLEAVIAGSPKKHGK